jgi:arabinan endo-1,5-alpha-L-arabinosidase
MNIRLHLRTSEAVMLMLSVAASAAAFAQSNEPGAPQALALSGEYEGTHDPSIAFDRGTYYVFATGAVHPDGPVAPPAPPAPDAVAQPATRSATAQLPQFQVRCSKDLHVWQRCGAVFPKIPEWIQQLSPKTRELWAPDISYFDGLYHLYYAFSAFGKNTSGIALATNETLDPTSPKYKWVDRGLVLQSLATDDFNAIDPNLVLDAKGEAWLAFGSFWKGIMMRHLDRATGLLSKSDTKIYSLASRYPGSLTQLRNPDLPPDTEAVEAPFVFHQGDYYYLFVSFDLCCRGVKSTYRTMVGRSTSVTGPYVDRDGRPMLEGGGSQILSANGKWLGPGGESLFRHDGTDYIVFHAYSAVNGHPALHISTIAWKDGWPEAALEGDNR